MSSSGGPARRFAVVTLAVAVVLVLAITAVAGGLPSDATDTAPPNFAHDGMVDAAGGREHSPSASAHHLGSLSERAAEIHLAHGYDETTNLARASARPAKYRLAPQATIGFADDAVGSAYQGMRSGGGHAMRHLMDEGLIPNSGSLASRAGIFEDLTSPILRNPSSTFNWRLGDTATRAFAGQAGGRQVVVFVAKEGPYQGRVISAVVPDANQVAQWGL